MGLMKKSRDFQRAKVYKLDSLLGLLLRCNIFKEELSLVQIKDITSKLFAEYNLGSPPLIKDGRGRRKAGGCRTHITMPRWARNMIVLSHELSHVVTQRKFEVEAPHGPRYVGIYREIVTRLTRLSKVMPHEA